MRRGAGWLLGGLLVVFVAVVAWCAPRYPEVVPMHWGTTGAPDSWAGRSAAIVTMLVVGIAYAAVFGLLGLCLAGMLSLVIMIVVRWRRGPLATVRS